MFGEGMVKRFASNFKELKDLSVKQRNDLVCSTETNKSLWARSVFRENTIEVAKISKKRHNIDIIPLRLFDVRGGGAFCTRRRGRWGASAVDSG